MPAIDLLFLHCGFVPECRARVDKHFDGYHTLQYMAAGAIEVAYDQQRSMLRGSWFWPAYPGPHIRFHAAPASASWIHRYVAFRGPLVSRWVSQGLWLHKPQPALAGTPWTRDFDLLLEQVRRGGRWGTLAAINQLERILIELAEQRAPDRAAEPWLDALLERLESLEPFDPEQFAQEHGMALSTLRRRFRAATGAALHDSAVQHRIARAREHLAETDEPIKSIARRLGYNDVYFFSRQFRQHTGLPPAVFRRTRQDR
jgi:AraC-like DNA-binding protein